MLRFFRKIRLALIPESRFGRYFFYAIGEVVLVIIGILFALQINNWNQNRLNTIQEKRILTDVLEELQLHKSLDQIGNSRMEEVISSAKNLLKLTENPPGSLNREQIDINLNKLTWVWVAATPTTIYDALSGSGELGLISSFDIRKKLAELNRNQELLLQFESTQSGFVDQQLRPFLNRTIDRTSVITINTPAAGLETITHYTPFSTPYNELLTNREFANLLSDLIYFTQRLLITYERINKDIVTIESAILSEYQGMEITPYIPY